MKGECTFLYIGANGQNPGKCAIIGILELKVDWAMLLATTIRCIPDRVLVPFCREKGTPLKSTTFGCKARYL